MSSLPNRRMGAEWTKALSDIFCYYSALQKALILSCILPPFNGESIEKQPESTGIVKCKKRDFVSLSEVSFSRILKCKQDVIKGCRQIIHCICIEGSCQQEGAERLVGVCIEEWVKVNLTSMYNEMEGAGAIALPLSIKNGMLTIKKGLDK